MIDFDKVVRDPANPDLMLPAFNCADGIHPSPRGYYEMGARCGRRAERVNAGQATRT